MSAPGWSRTYKDGGVSSPRPSFVRDPHAMADLAALLSNAGERRRVKAKYRMRSLRARRAGNVRESARHDFDGTTAENLAAGIDALRQMAKESK